MNFEQCSTNLSYIPNHLYSVTGNVKCLAEIRLSIRKGTSPLVCRKNQR